MKKYFNVMLIIFAICLLTGCEEQYTTEEKYNMCVDDFVISKNFDFTYIVKSNYLIVEETYKEFIQLAVWVTENEVEIEGVFKYYNYMYDDDLKDSADKNALDWYKIDEDMLAYKLEKEKNNLLSSLRKSREEYTSQIINVSCEEIQNNAEEILNYSNRDAWDYIAQAEKARVKNDYKEMLVAVSNMDFSKQVFQRIYPKEMLQGAIECLENVSTSESVDKAAAYLKEISYYEEYAEDIEWAYAKAHYLWRCDYGNCQNEGDTASEKHPGQYCSSHARMIDSGGKRKEKTGLSIDNSAGGWLPSGDMESYEGTSGSSNDNAFSKIETEEERNLDDPYNVYDYNDPEDFYYDNYDDFFDYEDAEDYYYEAWK